MWWICYAEKYTETEFETRVIEVHPFLWIKERNKEQAGCRYQLISFMLMSDNDRSAMEQSNSN